MQATTLERTGHCEHCHAMEVFSTSHRCKVCKKAFCQHCAGLNGVRNTGTCHDCQLEASVKENYIVKILVRPMQLGNLYWAYYINNIDGTHALVTPAEGRRTYPEASLDAKLNHRQIAHLEPHFKMAPMVQVWEMPGTLA